MSNIHLDDRPFFLIPSAFVVEGARRFLLCDTERKENFSIPIKYRALINNSSELTLSKAKINYGYSDEEFNAVIEFLTSNDLVYFSSITDFYKPLRNTFDYPAKITNAIVDIGPDTKFTALHAKQLEEINCFHLQIRYLRTVSLAELSELFNLLNNIFLKSLELAIPWGENITETGIAEAVKGFVFIDAVICYDCKEEYVHSINETVARIIYFTKQTLSLKSCGIVSQTYFSSNITAISESIKHNTCLNRKVSIDINGDIRNCPSMPETFGNIKETTLKQAVEEPGFKKYWDINKDKIHVCKDCEFRHVCTDCRAYIEDPEDIYSKPLKCGYNPYIGEWSEWSINPLKQRAIAFYGMEDIIEERRIYLEAKAGRGEHE